ncbi:E3 ubiquitin-protein ligase RNF25 [Takifugu rubripes]|uniref:E3 ubiquitin-protein ligase RNF25 n=1 Tax=Takifugu rubripes TaxID=31033 RepID=UPI001145E54D|nr:E3 ubiquitin-protein ligase RNF25 [Takifugu rubripes]
MAAECDVQSEIEVLQSIYLDELLVDRREDGGWEVSLVLHPSTAEDSVSQFVRLTLTLALDQQYPLTSPSISIQNSRGLSDEKLSSVQRCLQLEAQSCLGSPVLYQLIEKAKEILTESNIPHGSCAICLYDFKEGEAFTKTSCYHYFHCHCLGRYVRHSESELRQREKELEEDKSRTRMDCQDLTVVCPVCREPLIYDVDQLLSAPAPQLPEVDEAAISSSFRQKWVELKKLLERQRSKGGIIDPEVESNRFLIHINETVAENGSPEVDGSSTPTGPSVSQVSSEATGVRVDQPAPGFSHCRGSQAHRHQNPSRGRTRGGQRRPQHRRGPPITDHLNTLRLSSNCTEQSERAKAQASDVQPMQLVEGLRPPRPDGGLSPEHREFPGALSPDSQPAIQAASKAQRAGDAPDSRGHRQRRSGSHRSVPNSGAPGPPHHWDAKATRNRGGHSRGGGGHRRGYSRGFQHKVVDRDRGQEEVL